ncbi:TMEM175 family protein [Methanomassiliicoccus luminyensis]|jgi:uncharacterized membrane protein|uniref:TMEM175 family protein n=1 Tax=Methanomassiliicoccus luminyensis TaxID=1080712 RepID=UPI00036369AA|nr:TMEM175 family protein [Methanomassiliicoccus luminyensis]
MFKVRIEDLTDLVFGLALSIGAIALINRSEDDISDVLTGLFWFTFSFLILISVWISYSRIISRLKIESPRLLVLNVALLLLVAIEPYLLNVMAFDVNSQNYPELLNGASTLYALDLGGIWLIMAGFNQQAFRQGVEGREAFVAARNSRLIDAAIFLASALPVFWTLALFDLPVRFLIWYVSIPLGVIGHGYLVRRARERYGGEDDGA